MTPAYQLTSIHQPTKIRPTLSHSQMSSLQNTANDLKVLMVENTKSIHAIESSVSDAREKRSQARGVPRIA